MKIYTLYYTDAKLYNRSIFVMPNDEMAIKAMRLNLKDANAERFRNEAMEGNVELRTIAYFSEEDACSPLNNCLPETICNLKELLNDNNGNLAETKQDNAE